MPAFCNADRRLCVESAPSKFSEADLQTGSTDSLFIRSPQSGLAEKRSFLAILLMARSWHDPAVHAAILTTTS
jgi:hypothetical protein